MNKFKDDKVSGLGQRAVRPTTTHLENPLKCSASRYLLARLIRGDSDSLEYAHTRSGHPPEELKRIKDIMEQHYGTGLGWREWKFKVLSSKGIDKFANFLT